MSATLDSRTRASLLLAAGNPADEKAREAFAVCYGEVIRKWCRRNKLQEADQDDVVQSVVSRLLERLPNFKYDPSKRFRGYVQKATHSAIVDLNRERQRHPGGHGSGDTKVHGQLHEVPGPDDQAVEDLSNDLAEQMELVQRLHEACDRVRKRVQERTWKAFQLTEFGGQSTADVAQQLGLAPQHVLIHKHRVAKMIKSEFGSFPG